MDRKASVYELRETGRTEKEGAVTHFLNSVGMVYMVYIYNFY
jgi:hypothetical protein